MIKKTINSETCQTCAKCCLSWALFTVVKDDVLRVSWLDTDKITITKVKEGLWKILFNIPCKQLIKKGKKYYCKQHKGIRPIYCKTYPLSLLEKDVEPELLELEKSFCPALKELLKK